MDETLDRPTPTSTQPGRIAPNPDVVLVGASVRSLAESAVRDSLMPLCVDFFGDADLRELLERRNVSSAANPIVIDSYSEVVTRLEATDRSVPVLLTGGAENNLELIRQLHKQRPVANLRAEEIASLRDPAIVFPELEQAGCAVPPSRISPDFAQSESGSFTWLIKDINSSGGQAVRDWQPGDELSRGQFLQQQIHGTSISATFFAGNSDSSETSISLEGVALQLCGLAALNCVGYQYCGNVGGLQISRQLQPAVMKAARALTNRWPIRGFIGIDFVLNNGTPFVIEVNPRLTASHELHERQCPTGHVLRQLDAFTSKPDTRQVTSGEGRQTVARLVVYASDTVQVTSKQVDRMLAATQRHVASADCWLGDIPVAGSVVPKTTPLCSLYVVCPAESSSNSLRPILEAIPTDTSKLTTKWWRELQEKIEVVQNV